METSNKILIVSKSSGTADQISRAFPSSSQAGPAVETSTFATMNGHASEMAAAHNVVIFDADPDDDDELAAIRTMLADRPKDGFYIALTDEDVSIAKARRLREAGIDEVLPNTVSKGELNDLIERRMKEIRQKFAVAQGGAGEQAGAVIAVAQARGGIGSTTVAVNLARKLAGEKGFLRKTQQAKVALIDLDLQFGNANVFVDLEDNGGFMRLLELDTPPDENYVHGILQKHSSGFEILAAPQPIAPLHSINSELMGHLFDILRREYDFVVVDLPRALVEWIEPVLARTNTLLMVLDTSVPSVRQAKRLVDFYREANIGMNIEYVVNHETKPFMRSEAQKEAEAVLDTKFNHWIPDNPKIARKAVDLGQPVSEIGANSDMGKAFKKLASAVKEAATSSVKSA